MGFDLLRAIKCSIMDTLILSFWNLTFWIAACIQTLEMCVVTSMILSDFKHIFQIPKLMWPTWT